MALGHHVEALFRARFPREGSRHEAPGFQESISEAIEEIQEGAFFGAGHLREVYLPSRVRFIRDAAFQKCKNLRKVAVKNKKRISVVEGDVFEDCPRLKEWVKEKGKL